uniref:Endonuclease/exonuclease/phosphatase domain-containing protein n=2 Tax=Cacopsylla melanoneura TaxID=428564 RepID=A0A8D8TJZ3_9HEMI
MTSSSQTPTRMHSYQNSVAQDTKHNNGGAGGSNLEDYSSMKIYYQNCNGLRSKEKRIEFKNNCEQGPYHDFICLTETNLNDAYKSEDYFGEEYKVYRNDRPKRHPKTSGGGVLIAVRTPPPNRKEKFKVISRKDFNLEFEKIIENIKKDLVEDERHKLNYEMIENIWIDVTLPTCSLLIGNHYIHQEVPIGTIKTYCEFLERKIDSSAFKVLFVGDFNLPEFNWEAGTSTNVNSTIRNKSSLFYKLFCHLKIKQRVSHSTLNCPLKNILDLVVTNFQLDIERGDEMVKLEDIHPSLLLSVPLPKFSIRSDTIINQNEQFVNTNSFECTCTACGRECKSIQGLIAHQRNATCKEILQSPTPPITIPQQVLTTKSQQQLVLETTSQGQHVLTTTSQQQLVLLSLR